ncbi:hypothetical protein [Modestobacter sp. DSM 44400]|uniref:hypothetical protein n=1 Tax=Modestobacter sp. DSM 44400 TaxID=1550230 RepID=UPI000B84246C|nr:hypothetical protein [Modestobacter sp. DSM 44400]
MGATDPSTRSGKISEVRWVRQMRQASRARHFARQTQEEARREELREAVVLLMSDYDCQVQQGVDWIEVRGRPAACRFRIDLAGGLALLDAGDESEYVAEWVLGTPGEQADLVALLQRLVEGDLATLPPGLNNVRLVDYRSYLPLAPRQRSP